MHLFRFSTRGIAISLTIIVAIFLSACTTDTGSADEHGLIPHLTVDMQLPTELSMGSSGQFRVVVGQRGQPVETARTTFEFWPEGHLEQRVEIAGVPHGNGQYTAEFLVSAEGIYVVRCRVSSDKLESMPAKRFAIGEEAVLHLVTLEQQQSANAPPENGSSGGHHHH